MIIDLNVVEKLLTKSDFELIIQIGKLAKNNNLKIYLVGGLVRDIIRGHLFDVDIDIILEGNAINFAKKVADFFKVNCVTHEKYGTAKVKISESRTIDFATCRTEVYPYPASNPQVSFSSIEKDLFRRDFTINSIAMCINSESFGELFDPFNGYTDIKQKKLHILHDLSFYDDPNRIFRAVRFASKLNFQIGENTKNRAIETMNLGVFDYYINDRIKNEIRLIFTNKYKAVNNIKKLYELNSLRFFDPRLDFTDIEQILISIFNNIDFFKIKFNLNVIQWVLYTALLISRIKEEKNYLKLVDLFRFEKNELKIITEIKNIDFLYQTLNSKGLTSYDVYNILNKYELESIIYLLSLYNNPDLKDKVINYFNTTKHLKLTISGVDLIKLGFERGKSIGIVLDKIKKEKINGNISSFQDEFDLANSIKDQVMN